MIWRTFIVLSLLSTMTGCAERRAFWKQVDVDRTAQAQDDFGAGRKPEPDTAHR